MFEIDILPLEYARPNGSITIPLTLVFLHGSIGASFLRRGCNWPFMRSHAFVTDLTSGIYEIVYFIQLENWKFCIYEGGGFVVVWEKGTPLYRT
jgi:hypothetical protein